MDYERLLRENLIKKQKPDFGQIVEQIARAEKDIKTAGATMKLDPTWAVTIAYHAMIRAGRALMYANGFLPTAKFTHKTIVDFTGDALGKEYAVLTVKFDRLRKQRHDFIYESKNHVTSEEVLSAIDAAGKMLSEIKKQIKNINPQAELF